MFISLKNREMLISSEHVSAEMLISHTCTGSKMLHVHVLSINVDVTITNYDVSTKQSRQRAYTAHVYNVHRADRLTD